MRKILVSTFTLFFVLFLLLTITVNTAFAEKRYDFEMNINGEIYKQSVSVDTNIVLRKGKSFLSFAEEKLNDGLRLEDILNYISKNLGTAYFQFLSEKETQPVNAELIVDTKCGTFDYVYGKKGRLFDEKEAVLELAKALDGGKASLTLKDAMPEVTAKDLRNRTALMGNFATYYANSSVERKHNIQLASSFLNGVIVKSGESFSFNEVVGERTEERGFKNAKVIADGEYVDGIGGGVCQVSSTLYNAVLLAGLKVKRVARHTFAPSYVAPSRDAMVSTYSDFCFINNTPYDIYIFSNANQERINVRIYGLCSENIQIESQKVEILPFENVDKNGNLLLNVEDRILISNGIDGIKSELYVIKNGERIKVRSDVYKSKNAVYE